MFAVFVVVLVVLAVSVVFPIFVAFCREDFYRIFLKNVPQFPKREKLQGVFYFVCYILLLIITYTQCATLGFWQCEKQCYGTYKGH